MRVCLLGANIHSMLRSAPLRLQRCCVRKGSGMGMWAVLSVSRHIHDKSLSPNYNAKQVSTTTDDSSASSVSRVRSLYKSTHRSRALTSDVGADKMADVLLASTAGKAAENLAAGRSSCAEDRGPVPDRPLTALQKRQLLFQNKAAFVLAPNALRRVQHLLAQYAAKAKENELIHLTANHDNYLHTGIAPQVSDKEKASVRERPASSAPRLPVGIRIGVRRRGCSGYSYTVNYYFGPEPKSAPCIKEDHDSKSAIMEGRSSTRRRSAAAGVQDVIVDQSGVNVVVDGDALFYVIGTTMDYVVRDVEEKFVFMNPNQKFSCGCEESFMPFGSDDLDED